MKATEARLLAKKKNTNDADSQYAKIKSKIIISAKNGDYYMYWYELFNNDVKEKLIDDGYTVGNTTHDQRDGSMTKISW